MKVSKCFPKFEKSIETLFWANKMPIFPKRIICKDQKISLIQFQSVKECLKKWSEV